MKRYLDVITWLYLIIAALWGVSILVQIVNHNKPNDYLVSYQAANGYGYCTVTLPRVTQDDLPILQRSI